MKSSLYITALAFYVVGKLYYSVNECLIRLIDDIATGHPYDWMCLE